MTRWARGGSGNKRKEYEASSWSKLKREKSSVSSNEHHFSSRTSSHEEKQFRAKTSNRIKNVEQESEYELLHHVKKNKKLPRTVKKKMRKGLLDSLMDSEETESNMDQFSKDTYSHEDNEGEEENSTGVAGMLEATAVQTTEAEQNEIDELSEVIKKDKRREKRRLKRLDKRQSDMTCFNCRKKGHNMSECPKLRRDVSQGTGICFKCGSTEHNINRCPVKLPKGVFPYAKCFICKETGHLSSQCPDNPRGLYPNGGCCKICSSVEHYKKDCPELHKKQGIDDIQLERVTGKYSADEEKSLLKKSYAKVKKKGPKIVKF